MNAPSFTLTAEDEFAPHCLLDYAARCQERGMTAKADDIRRQAGAMFAWRDKYGTKTPVAADNTDDGRFERTDD